MDLYAAIHELRTKTDSVMVGVSGKDSFVCLDLCKRFIPNVKGFFMHVIPGLSFQERYWRYLEDRYQIEIIRLPHWNLSRMFKTGTMRRPTPSSVSVPLIGEKDIEAHLRDKHGATWIVRGLRKSDGFSRRYLLGRKGGIVDEKYRRAYPVAEWRTAHILAYIKLQKIILPPEYKALGASFIGLAPDDLIWCRDQHPSDYAKILKVFPEAPAIIAKHSLFGPDKVPKFRQCKGPSKPAKPSALQPTDNQPGSP